LYFLGSAKVRGAWAEGYRVMEGSNFVEVNENITLGCISEEARDLLDTIMTEWEKNEAKHEEIWPGYEPSIYAFAYWLVRWSGLVQPAPHRPPPSIAEEGCE
jgi:hypothetical protein